MTNKKVTLPRHTILAKQSSRIGALIVDFAFTFLLTLGLFYGCFGLIFTNFVTNNDVSKMATYEINSHLVNYNNEEKKTSIIQSDDDYTVYEIPVKYFYMSYLTGENIEVPSGGDTSNPLKYAAPNYDRQVKIDENTYVTTKEFYSVGWYNKNVLGIEDADYTGNEINANVSAYFTYQKDAEGNINKNLIGVPRTERYDSSSNSMVEITPTQLAKQYKDKYIEAYYTLIDQPFYSNLATRVNFYTGLSFVIPFVISSLISYVIIPLFTKDGATIGKLLFKICLANYEGYKFKKYQLLLRIIPLLLVEFSLVFIQSSIYVCLAIPTIIGLVSFCLMMASPKKSALHDCLARTIVVDKNASVLFNNPIEEEKYLLEEDKKDEKIICGGEEPELKYEK